MSGIQIIQEHYLVFDIEIKFSTKETAQVFVDEIIKIVLCRIVLQMLHQQSAFLILFCWHLFIDQLCKVGIFSFCKRINNLSLSILDKCILLGSLRHQLISKGDVKLTIFLCDTILFTKLETALHIVGSLVVVLLCIRITKNKVYLTTTGWQHERVILEILRSLDVILVGICPIQLHFLTTIRNGIGIVLIATFRDKIATLIITAKEFSQMRKHLILQGRNISSCSSLSLQNLCDFRNKAIVQERLDILTLLIHNAIYTKVEFGLVELQYFCKYISKFLFVLCHCLYYLVILSCFVSVSFL